MELKIDFSGIINLESMLKLFREKIGSPDSFGTNGYALIDSLRTMRRNDETKETTIHLKEEEILVIELKYFPISNRLMVLPLLEIVKSVNKEFVERGEKPLIALVFV